MCVFVYIYINSNPTKHCITNPRERKKKKREKLCKTLLLYILHQRKKAKTGATLEPHII